MNNQSQTCFLCGSTENLSRDHVPPKNLFKPPLPSNMVTVLSCAPCNESYSLDEEYFRACVATEGYWHETGRWIWKKKVVQSSFKRSPALRKEIASHIFPIRLHSPSGLYLGKAEGVGYQSERITRVIDKIARGLFVHHYPEIDLKEVDFNVSKTAISNGLSELLSQMKRESIGGETFIYWRGYVEGNQKQSIWFLLFYTMALFSVQTYPTSGAR